ncbi:hypothetical protein D3Z52_15605 [Clostridiaceae bacterium]|nr:hypothetical protein [Clostridiaceae bacterium]
MGGVLARKTPCRNAHTDVLFFLLYSTFNWKCNHNSKIFGQDEQPPNARQLLGLQKKAAALAEPGQRKQAAKRQVIDSFA